MITYSYKCSRCNQVQDRQFPMGKAPSQINLSCDNCSPWDPVPLTRMWVHAGIVFHGDGWGGKKDMVYPANTVSLDQARRLGYVGPDPRDRDVDPKDFKKRVKN